MCSRICPCACWITLDVPARCSFWYRTCKRSHFVRVRALSFCCGVFSYSSPRPLVTLCALDGSCCGTVLSLIWLSQPSQHFVRVRSLSLWCGANIVSCFSQTLWNMVSLEDPSMRILREFHSGPLICRSWRRYCRSLCERILYLHDLVHVLVRRPCGCPSTS